MHSVNGEQKSSPFKCDSCDGSVSQEDNSSQVEMIAGEVWFATLDLQVFIAQKVSVH